MSTIVRGVELSLSSSEGITLSREQGTWGATRSECAGCGVQERGGQQEDVGAVVRCGRMCKNMQEHARCKKGMGAGARGERRETIGRE